MNRLTKNKSKNMVIFSVPGIIAISIFVFLTACHDNTVMEQNKTNCPRPSSPISHKIINREGCDLHYYVTGKDAGELIVFLHPAFADHRCFNNQLDYFAEDYKIITIDLPGHGLSVVTKPKEKIDESIKQLKMIIEKEGYQRAHLVGVSMGSLLAQYFASLYPEKILTLTILGGYNIHGDNDEIIKAQRREGFKWMIKALFSMNSFRRYVASVSVIKPGTQACFYEMAKSFKRKSFMVMGGLGNILDKRRNMSRAYPLLISCGEKDIELSLEASKHFHEITEGSIFYVISDAGHCANMDNPSEFNRILKEFISN